MSEVSSIVSACTSEGSRSDEGAEGGGGNGDVGGKRRAPDSGYTSGEEGQRAKRVRQDSSSRSKDAEDKEHVIAGSSGTFHHEALPPDYRVPSSQRALLLLGKKQAYTLTEAHGIPELDGEKDEVLIRIQSIGLNPIDWKAPDYGFGIPELPYIAGRDLVGTIVAEGKSSATTGSRPLRKGDVVFSASTDYRDLRKAAYQEYAVASRFNVARVPRSIRKEKVAGVGVAFIAAVLALGVCLGADFSELDGAVRGPNLKTILANHADRIPKDVKEESLAEISPSERPRRGDWIVIWGGSSTTALMTAQLCKLLGLRVIKVLDVGKHGEEFSQGPADLLVDSHDPERAISIIRRVTGNQLRLGIDVVGRPTSELLRRTLRFGNGDDASGAAEGARKSHLVGLTGLPKVLIDGVQQHTVPIKVHHEVPEVGEALMRWLEILLSKEMIVPPVQETIDGGLGRVNEGLDRMRRGEISGKRLAINMP